MREQAILLWHKSHVTGLRRKADLFRAVEPALLSKSNGTGIGPLDSGNAAQQGRFAGAGWPEHDGHAGFRRSKIFNLDTRAGFELAAESCGERSAHDRDRARPSRTSLSQRARKAMRAETAASAQA